MQRKFFKIILIVMQIFIASIFVAFAAFLWRLHQSPINIDKLIPYLSTMTLSPEKSITVQSAQMQWGGWKKPIEISLKKFHVFENKNDLVLSVPKMSVSFSFSALLRGSIAPKTMSFFKPALFLNISKDGVLKEKEKKQEDKNKGILPINSIVKLLKEEKHLSEFSLIDAKITITDELRGAVWKMPSVNLKYRRSFRKKDIKGSVAVEMKHKKQPLILDVKGDWKTNKKQLNLSISVKDLDLKDSLTAQKYPYLKNFTTPVDITINTKLNAKPIFARKKSFAWPSVIEKIGFNISGEQGKIHLPAPVFAYYDLKKFNVSGAWENKGNDFNIKQFNVVTQTNAIATGQFLISGVSKALKKKSWAPIKAKLLAKADNIPVNSLPNYWPASIGSDVHAWIKENLKQGMITDADFDLDFIGLKEGGINVKNVKGTVDAQGTTVRYLPKTPLVTNAAGHLIFSRDKILINILSGKTGSLTVKKDTNLTFLDLTKDKQFLDLNLNASGDVSDVVKILNSPDLQLNYGIEIKPENFTGKATGNLKLNLPLEPVITDSSEIKVKANVDVLNADIKNIVNEYGIQDAIFNLDIDNQNINIDGTSLFYGATTKFNAFHTHNLNKEVSTDVNIKVDFNDTARTALNFGFMTPNTFSGIMPTVLDFKHYNSGKSSLNVSSDLTEAAVNVAPIGWQKQIGVKGNALLKLYIDKSNKIDIPEIKVQDDNGTNIQGFINFDNVTHNIKQLEFNTIKAKRTDAKLKVSFDQKDVKIDFSGAELDISELIKSSETGQESPVQDSKKNNKHKSTQKTTFINATIDKLWVSKKGYSEDNTIVAEHQYGWKKIQANASVGEEKVPLNFSLTPTTEKDKYNVIMTSKDAGYTLKALDYISTVKGGNLDLKGTYIANKGSFGTLKVSDFYLEEQQTLTRLLMLTSLTGIIDSFKGEGLFFDKADIPYKTNSSMLEIDDAVISGPSLGITLKGKYYRETSYVNFRGSLVPFYTLNSFLGKIPLIGRIFSGEKGGGLIAPTYTVKGKMPTPAISVNGFSALAPGAIRSLFNSIPSDADLSKNEKATIEPKQKKQTTIEPKEPATIEPKEPTIIKAKVLEDTLHYE